MPVNGLTAIPTKAIVRSIMSFDIAELKSPSLFCLLVCLQDQMTTMHAKPRPCCPSPDVGEHVPRCLLVFLYQPARHGPLLTHDYKSVGRVCKLLQPCLQPRWNPSSGVSLLVTCYILQPELRSTGPSTQCFPHKHPLEPLSKNPTGFLSVTFT